MKALKRSILALISVTFILIGLLDLPVRADDTSYSSGHFYYHSHAGYVSISGYLGKEEKVEIPSSIAGRPVAEIESGAFRECHTIRTIIIPDTVTIVHEDSFTGAGSLQRIICNSPDISITADGNVDVVYTSEKEAAVIAPSGTGQEASGPGRADSPASGKPGAEEPASASRAHGSGQGEIKSDAQGSDILSPASVKDPDLGESAYEEDGMPGEAAGQNAQAASGKAPGTPGSSDQAGRTASGKEQQDAESSAQSTREDTRNQNTGSAENDKAQAAGSDRPDDPVAVTDNTTGGSAGQNIQEQGTDAPSQAAHSAPGNTGSNRGAVLLLLAAAIGIAASAGWFALNKTKRKRKKR